MAANAGADRDVADVVGDVGRARWWGLGFGVLSVIAGVIALAWPDITVVVLAIVFGVQLFVLGIFRVVAALAMPDTSVATKVLSVVLGVLSFIVGILCLRSPLQTVVVLTLVLGAFWLIHGIVDIVIGISGRGEDGRGWTIVAGVTGVLAGIVVLSWPEISAVTLAQLLGFLLVLQGIIVAIVSSRQTRPTEPSPTSSVDPIEATTPGPGTRDAARHAAG